MLGSSFALAEAAVKLRPIIQEAQQAEEAKGTAGSAQHLEK
jgi:hypothetical protein